jgi:hypothetical protein
MTSKDWYAMCVLIVMLDGAYYLGLLAGHLAIPGITR